MIQIRNVALLVVAFVVNISFSNAQVTMCLNGTIDGTESSISCTTFCGRTETGGTIVGSCETDAAACDALCAGTADCMSACCNDADDCNNDTVAAMREVVTCGVGTYTGSAFPTPAMVCAANELCGRKEVTPASGTATITGSCTAAAVCETLCNGETDACVSACCNDADTCNTRTVAEMSTYVRCGSGTDATAAMLTCASGSLCGRKEVTGTGAATTGSCSTQAECDALCVGTASCTAACCNNADDCNSRTVAEIGTAIVCGTGTMTNGAFPSALTCGANEFCGRTETTSGSTTIVGSCSDQATCDGFCSGATGCVSSCCNNADFCNTLTVAIQNDLICIVGTTTTVGSATATGSLVATHCSPNSFCGRTETTTTSGGVSTVVVVGSCQASADSCDLLCANDANCVRACCNDADGCNSNSVATMTSILTCHTGTVTGTTLTATTTCTTDQVCGRTETTSGGNTDTVGSCQAQTNCTTLCGSATGCVSACCSSSDLCNSLTVSQQTARNCYVGSSTSATPVSEMTYTRCAAAEQCGRTQTTATSGTVTTVGSCTAASACDTLCGTTNTTNCVSTCCDTDGCNSAAIATTTTTTTTASTTTTISNTSGAEHAAQINMLVMMGLVVLGYFMA